MTAYEHELEQQPTGDSFGLMCVDLITDMFSFVMTFNIT